MTRGGNGSSISDAPHRLIPMHMLMRVQVLGRPGRQPLNFGKLFFNVHFYSPLVLSRRDFVEQHRIQGATDLLTWSDLGTNTAASNGTFQFEDATATGFARRFYRLVTP